MLESNPQARQSITFIPCGIVKLSTAALEFPLLVTEALVPGAPVVVVPTPTVAPHRITTFWKM